MLATGMRRMARVAEITLVACVILQIVEANILLQMPRGSNNRINEASNNVRRQNRMFNSRNLNRGGYNMGDATDNGFGNDASKQYTMEYFMSGRDYTIDDQKKTSLWLEWTNDEGCGTNTGDNAQENMNCNIVIQFNCRPPSNDKDNMREGVSEHINDYDDHRHHNRNFKLEAETYEQYEQRKNGRVKDERGVHETFEEYEKCYNRRQNQGLYRGDQLQGPPSAISTRQNQHGHRYGYECPEERDYFPYWHPTSWRDIAVMSENISFCESFYQKESFNVKPKYECMMKFHNSDKYHSHTKYNNEGECLINGGEWLKFTSFLEYAPQHTTKDTCEGASDNAIKYVWGRPMGEFEERCLVALSKPECHEAPWTRPNHLGNMFKTGEPASFEWKLPHFPSGDSQSCVLRIRYNVTSNDIDPHNSDRSQDSVLSYTEAADSLCPAEPGFCINNAGHDQNSKVDKVNGVDGNTEDAQKTCLEACLNKPGATACEVIWNQGNRGCYIHRADVSRGNGHGNHMCWVLKRCTGKGPTGTPFTATTEYGTNLAFEKLATMSSEAHGHPAYLATDGNPSITWHGGSCIHTATESNPWWRVDIGESKKIDMVVIRNRGDCCQEKLSNFRLTIGDNANGDDNAVCMADGGDTKGRKEIEVMCDPPLDGRYIEIKVPGNNRVLFFAEVMVFEYNPNKQRPINIAKGKYATSSSVGHGGVASRATDGNDATNWHAGSCIHTKHESNPWFRVDLGGPAVVNHVEIYNRADCCQDRLSGFVVTVGDNHLGIGNTQCGATGGHTRRREKIDVYCDPALKGRYVHVKQSAHKIMNLCEVKVFGVGGGDARPAGIDSAGTGQITELGENLAFGGDALQSSAQHGGQASRAVDGDTDGFWDGNSCTHSHYDEKAWFRVKLKRSAAVKNIILYNRKDCCSERLRDAEVFVGITGTGTDWQKCGSAPSDTKDMAIISVECQTALTGQYVLVRLPRRDHLTICEIQVYEEGAAAAATSNQASASLDYSDLPDTLPAVNKYKHEGCFKDEEGNHAIPSVEGVCNYLDGDKPEHRMDATEKCYKCALMAGNRYFALHKSGVCMTSSDADQTYQKHGSSDSCGAEGTGTDEAIDVYSIIGPLSAPPKTSTPIARPVNVAVRTEAQIETGVKNLRLQLAIRTKNIIRTNQDRTHVFTLSPRPSSVADKLIHNLNVRGKRGNIVQTFSAHEYDFFPTDLVIKEDDVVHIQWTGSNTNDKNNAGQGKKGADRNNIVQIADRSVNYPITPLSDAPMFMNAKVHWASEYSSKGKLDPIDVAVQMATAGYLHCESGCDQSAQNNQVDDELAKQPASYKGMMLSFAKGEYHYMCTVNNNFSNRAQKASIIVT